MDPEIIEETQLPIENISDDEEIECDSVDEEKQTTHYIQRVKLAVAIALIRSTPRKMTPEKYAAVLIQSFTEDVNSWKNKCEILEREMLDLEQKLQTVHLKERANISDLNMDIHDAVTIGNTSRPYQAPSSTLGAKISTTIDFVRSFILLGSVTNDNSLNQNDSKESHETIRDMILKSIKLLFGYLLSKDGLVLDFGIARRAVTEVHRLFDARANFFENDLMKVSLEFVDNLLLDIYKTLEINMVSYQHRRSALIQMIAEHKRLTPLVLTRLMREITILSDGLSEQFRPEVEDYTSLLHVENAYYVFQATEGIIHIMRQQDSVLNALKITKNLLAEWDKTTEKSLLEIGNYFPMYSYYIWHVKALLKSVLCSDLS